ncbi:MAG TPA: hypothetical protein VMT86_00660 [Bryobacteraceae bacterium]|nr:hypothetical protein [Bryobacteraceae bacterium]
MSSAAMCDNRAEPVTRGLCRIGSAVAFFLIVYCFATMVQLTILGGQPSSAAAAFALLQSNRLVGLLRLDVLTVFVLPLYYLLFLALAMATWRVDGVKAILSALFVFTGVTLVLATPMGLSMVPLSAKYAAASTDAARSQFLAAGEAILASDIWHGTGACVGGILTQVGAALICIPMLKSVAFGKLPGWLGLLTHGLDLAHIVLGLFMPAVGTILMVVAGPMYPVWFFLIGRGLWKVSRSDFPAAR